MGRPSLVPRPSPAQVFDRLQYANLAQFLHTARDQKLEPGEGLATRLVGSHVSEYIDGECVDNWMCETILCIQSRYLCVGYGSKDSHKSDKCSPTVV